MSATSRRDRWAVLLLAVLVVLFWATRLVAPGHDTGLASGDLRLYFYPTYEAFYRLLARGRLLAWNPYQLCGIPWLGVPSGGFFYPPHALYLVLPTHLALAASSLLHLVVIALSTMLLARRTGLGIGAALLAAVLFSLRGFVPQWVRWPYVLEAGAWLPLGCVGVLGLAVRESTRRSVALLATATGMSWLAGGPQATVFLLYAWATLLLALLLGGHAGPRRWLGAGIAFAAALALGTLLGAAQLLPGMEMAREGTRAARELDVARMLPMGNAGLQALRDAVTGSAVSFGVIGLSLAPAAVLGRHRALALWAVAVGAVALAFSLGPATPLFRAYLALPLLGGCPDAC